MKIRFAEATGCPYGQFIVYPESESDRAILSTFLKPQELGEEGWGFHIHGTCYNSEAGLSSFNFGWHKKKMPLITRITRAWAVLRGRK